MIFAGSDIKRVYASFAICQTVHQCFRYAIRVGKFADEAVLFLNCQFYRFNRILWRGNPVRVCERKHLQIIEMITSGKNLAGLDAEQARKFGEGGAFVIGRMTEARVNVVTYDGQFRNAAAVFLQILINHLGVAIVSRD